MSIVETEQVMVVPTSLFQECGYFQGFCNETEKYLPKLLDTANTTYAPRPKMELDPSFKQLIPYCIFKFTDESGVVQLFQYTRGKGQGESRLHSKRSIGIGGHISTLDLGTGSAYEEGMKRELDEEVIIETTYSESCVGLINDDSNEVGQVHLGVVHLFNVDAPKVKARETEIIQSGFVPVSELLNEIEGFETWSQICLRALFQ